MNTTITPRFSARFGQTYWIVQWGVGITQQAICLSLAEAEALARGEKPAPAVPLVALLGSR
jgi:hypothetical protein